MRFALQRISTGGWLAWTIDSKPVEVQSDCAWTTEDYDEIELALVHMGADVEGDWDVVELVTARGDFGS